MKHIKDYITEKLHINKDTQSFDQTFYFPEIELKIQLPFTINILDMNTTVEIFFIEESSDKYAYLFYDANHELVVRLSKAYGVGNLFIDKVNDPKINLVPKLYNVNGKSINASYSIELDDPKNCIIKESKDTNNYANMIIVNKDDQILILQRSGYMKRFPGKWGFPGGHMHDNEDSKTTAIRELKEETGIELTFNEEHKCKKVDSIINDGSISDYWITVLETNPEVKISREHRKFEWYHYDKKDDRLYKWMPNVYELIQKYYQDEFKVA